MTESNKGIIQDLSAGEDDFDTDMMAAGCRVRFTDPVEETDPAALVELYGFDAADLTHILESLVSDGALEMNVLYQYAEKAAEARQHI